MSVAAIQFRRDADLVVRAVARGQMSVATAKENLAAFADDVLKTHEMWLQARLKRVLKEGDDE